MDTKILEAVTGDYTKVEHPDFHVGDIVEVHTKLMESGKERVQMFKGIVLAIKGAGVSKTFTVRKISYGVGVERMFPLYSPRIVKIKIVKRASKIRSSKLYYLRDRVGKSALKAGVQIPAVGEDLETKFEKEVEVAEKEAGKKEAQEGVKEEATDEEKQEDVKNGEPKEKEVAEKKDETEKSSDKQTSDEEKSDK
ncbi:50S ribosomal protein L19 [Patescibacteria group bacterium]|nr:50S ribosomal protein L19 [Patescibacteria group bacterium]